MNPSYFEEAELLQQNHLPAANQVQLWARGWTTCPQLHHVHLPAPMSAHLQALDGLELCEWMGSDSIKARAEPFKLHSTSCLRENPTGREGRRETKKFSGRYRQPIAAVPLTDHAGLVSKR